jgi:hypothetical protein
MDVRLISVPFHHISETNVFIGHFGVAFLLFYLFPGVPIWVALVGVSFPDLLWAIFVPLGLEELTVDPDNPLQKSLQFRKLPYSHSLVITNVMALAVGGVLAAVLGNPLALLVFVLASASHWALDIVVHLKDIPVLGFDGDRKLGFGLWRWGGFAFFVELAIYVILAAAFISGVTLVYVLIVGIVFHLINANSFFGFTKKNPFRTPNRYAGVALFGFVAMTVVLGFIL